MIIREVMMTDEVALWRLYQEFIEDMNSYDPSDENMDEEVRKWIDRALRKEQSTIVVVCEGDELYGFARVQEKRRVDEHQEEIQYAKLSDLFVSPKARRRRLATKLISASIDWGNERNLSEIILNVYEQNTSARQLYESIGFKEDSKISLGRIRMKRAIKN